MCQRHGVAFILDGITSVGGLPVRPEEWGAEAVVVGTEVYCRTQWNCSNCGKSAFYR